MAEDKEDREEGGFHNQNPNPNHNNNISKKGSKVKSCKGYLRYSSLLRDKSKNPTCVGIPRTLHKVPIDTFWETESEASKKDHSQTMFEYACVGYSVFLNKDSSSDQQNKQVELPICTGFEVFLEAAPPRVNKDDGRVLPQPEPRTCRPAHSTGEGSLNRFKSSASLVASGVAKNVNRVGIYIKESLDDILYPDRKQPK